MSFYRAPVNPGWDDFGARIQQGVQTGIGLMMEGRQRRRDQRRQDEQDRIAATERERQHTVENAELGVVPETDAYETVQRPSLAAVAAGGTPFTPDWMGSPDGQWHGENHDIPGTADVTGLSRLAAGSAAPAAPATERQLRPGVVHVGGLFIDPTRSLAFQRQQAATAAERASDEALRERKRTEVRVALVASGMDPQNADRRATAAAYGLTLPETPEERAERIRAEESAREPYRIADDNRTFGRALAIRAAIGDGGGGGRVTPSQQRAARNETRAQVEDTAYRLIRSDPTISEQELFDAMGEYRGEVSANDILNGIASAQSRYGREHGSGQMGQIQERGRAAQAQRRQAGALAKRRGGNSGGASGGARPAGGAPAGGQARAGGGNTGGGRPAPSGRSKQTITQAEYNALKGRGFTDQQIRSKYQVP